MSDSDDERGGDDRPRRGGRPSKGEGAEGGGRSKRPGRMPSKADFETRRPPGREDTRGPRSKAEGQGDDPWSKWRRPQRGGRSRDEGPSRQRPREGDRPRSDRPWGDRPPRDRPRSDRPGGDRPRDDRPRGDRPRGDRPRGDRPPRDRPWSDRPQGDRPRGDRPWSDRRYEDRPREERRWEPPVELPVDETTRKTGLSLSKLDQLEVTVEKLVAGGDGLARTEDGIPLFIPLAAPGDRLRVRLTERRSGYGRAEIEEILEPGPGRREPPCPHFDRCGGCALQHLDESHQLRYKAEAVRENLRRLGGLDAPANISVIPGKPWGYRLRTQLHVAETDRGRELGYYERGSHQLVPIKHCPVLVPELEAQLGNRAEAMREERHDRIDVVAGDGGEWTSSPGVDALPQGEIRLTVGEFEYHLDARCFFQGHRDLLPRLVEAALGDLADADGEAFDLYAGVGLFALPLARRYRRVTAVEAERDAVRFGRRNARTNEVGNLEYESQSVDTWIVELPEGVARVVVDPPRVGLSETVRRTLLERRPRRLTYVSCDSATLARDLAELKQGYLVESMVLIDLFPQTGHLEAVVQLALRGGDGDPGRGDAEERDGGG